MKNYRFFNLHIHTSERDLFVIKIFMFIIFPLMMAGLAFCFSLDLYFTVLVFVGMIILIWGIWGIRLLFTNKYRIDKDVIIYHRVKKRIIHMDEIAKIYVANNVFYMVEMIGFGIVKPGRDVLTRGIVVVFDKNITLDYIKKDVFAQKIYSFNRGKYIIFPNDIELYNFLIKHKRVEYEPPVISNYERLRLKGFTNITKLETQNGDIFLDIEK